MSKMKTKIEIKDQAANNRNSLVALANKFLHFSKVVGYSPSTIKGFRYDLTFFISWCYQLSVITVCKVSREIIEKYLCYLKEYKTKRFNAPLSVHTRCGYMSTLNSFFNWLVKKQHILYNPAGCFKYPKVHSLPRGVLSYEEAEAILNQPDISTPMGLRNRAIMELMYSSGIRRMEIINITLQDIDLENGILIVVEGKGKKDRYVPINDRAIKWVEKYLAEARPLLVGSHKHDFLFTTKDGVAFTQAETLSCMVRSYIKSTDITKKGACHLFRHTMATLMLENGADVRYIAEILGHNQVSTTQIYTRVTIKQLKRAHALAHPANFDPEVLGEDDG